MHVRKEIIDKIKNNDKLLTEYVELINEVEDIGLEIQDFYYDFFESYSMYGTYNIKIIEKLQEDLTAAIDAIEAFEKSLK